MNKSTTSTALSREEAASQLASGSLGLGESVAMGVACTAPAFSVAATTATLVGAVGILSVSSLLYCGLIMFGVTFAFMHLNRVITNAGASYAWAGEAFGPFLGFVAGWSLLVASAVFMVSGSVHPAHVISWQTLLPTAFTPSVFATGALTALFFFWGWDVTLNLNEETRDADTAPGRGAVVSMVIVMLLFMSFALGCLLVLSDAEIEQSSTNVMFAIADKLFPRPWSYLRCWPSR